MRVLPTLLGALLPLNALVGCASRDDVRDLVMDDTTADWSRHGFVEMVAPLKLPTTERDRDDVRVWLKLPPAAKLTARWMPDQSRFVLDYTPGSIAARVESRGKKVADVRGTRIAENGKERFFVYRPVGEKLRGVSWSRDDTSAQEQATERLVTLVPAAAGAHLRRQNGCAGCHIHARPRNAVPGEHGVANRATDAGGFFQVQTVLEDEAPLESYKPNDPNLDSPFVSIRCGEQQAIRENGDVRKVRCEDGRVPVGTFDVRAALAAHDEHATRVCNARRALAPHLDGAALRAFGAALDECGIDVFVASP